MASYYYLISSLPSLRADGEMPFSYADFLAQCRGTVSEKTFRLLEELSLSSREGPLLREWGEFYGVLAEELAYQRNERLGRPARLPAVRDAVMTKTVAAALSAVNPLEGERQLLALEFDRLDGLVSMHYFDDHVLFGYALKLKLMERLTAFDGNKGKAEFRRLLELTRQKITSIG